RAENERSSQARIGAQRVARSPLPRLLVREPRPLATDGKTGGTRRGLAAGFHRLLFFDPPFAHGDERPAARMDLRAARRVRDARRPPRRASRRGPTRPARGRATGRLRGRAGRTGGARPLVRNRRRQPRYQDEWVVLARAAPRGL